MPTERRRCRCATGSFSVASIEGMRTAGLGNLALPWAKAIVGALDLSAVFVGPPLRLNVRRYDRVLKHADFRVGTSRRLAAHVHAGQKIRFTEDQYLSTGQYDYGDALTTLLASSGLDGSAVSVFHSGMWGGYLGVRRALPILKAQLLALTEPRHVNREVALDPARVSDAQAVVAAHVRLGDFRRAPAGPGPGDFNTAVPIRWYERVIGTIRDALGDAVRFAVYTDSPSALRAQSGTLAPHVVSGGTVTGDLLGMAQADALVCSVSSYSMLAAALSGKPYIWFEPHLTTNGDSRSIWAIPSRRSLPNEFGIPRGVPSPMSGAVASSVLSALDSRAHQAGYSLGSDLVFHGAV